MSLSQAPTQPTTQPTYQYCPRCDGRAIFPQFAHVRAGLCFRCEGTGAVVNADPQLEARADRKAQDYTFDHEAGEWWICRNTRKGTEYRVAEAACTCPDACYRKRPCIHQVLLSRHITRLEQEAEEAEREREIAETVARSNAEAADAAYRERQEALADAKRAWRERPVATRMAEDWDCSD